jgi:hypothetical protein
VIVAALLLSLTMDTFLEVDVVTCQMWAETANTYITMGSERAPEQVMNLVERPTEGQRHFTMARRYEMLRLLYDPKPGQTLRFAQIGALLAVPTLSMRGSSWPEMPFIMQDGVIFVASEGYTLAGVPESWTNYAAYLKENGVFRTQLYKVPTHRQANAAFHQLLVSERWKAIKWHDSGPGQEYTISPSFVSDFLKKQVGE